MTSTLLPGRRVLHSPGSPVRRAGVRNPQRRNRRQSSSPLSSDCPAATSKTPFPYGYSVPGMPTATLPARAGNPLTPNLAYDTFRAEFPKRCPELPCPCRPKANSVRTPPTPRMDGRAWGVTTRPGPSGQNQPNRFPQANRFQRSPTLSTWDQPTRPRPASVHQEPGSGSGYCLSSQLSR